MSQLHRRMGNYNIDVTLQFSWPPNPLTVTRKRRIRSDCRVYETFHRVSGVRPQYRISHVHYPEEHRDRDSAGTQEYRHQYAGVPVLLAISRGGHVTSDAFGSLTAGQFCHWEAAFAVGVLKRAIHRHKARASAYLPRTVESAVSVTLRRAVHSTRVLPTRRDGRVIFFSVVKVHEAGASKKQRTSRSDLLLLCRLLRNLTFTLRLSMSVAGGGGGGQGDHGLP